MVDATLSPDNFIILTEPIAKNTLTLITTTELNIKGMAELFLPVTDKERTKMITFLVQTAFQAYQIPPKTTTQFFCKGNETLITLSREDLQNLQIISRIKMS
jgi:hypothetical protein